MCVCKNSFVGFGLILLACTGIQIITRSTSADEPSNPHGWTQSYDAGYVDVNGVYAGGSEIMHLVSHKGKLFAANGYWKDSRWEVSNYADKQSTQVLRLDSSDGPWEIDLDFGVVNARGLRYMKGNILKSVVFTCDEFGNELPEPDNLLVAASGTYWEGLGGVSACVRDDETGTWNHAFVKHGSSANGIRWIPRDMEVYRDKVTGAERLFLLIGNPGIISGVYDPSQPTKIRWDADVEFPETGAFKTRPLGMAQTNGSLLFSVEGSVYQRIDGEEPTYVEVVNLGDGVNTDVGGVRGLTTIDNPKGPGESILFMWAPNGRSSGQIKRLDPDGIGGYALHDEAAMSDLMGERLGVDVRYVLGAHSNFYPVRHPATGETVHIVGFQGTFNGREELHWSGSRLYAGAMYAVRYSDQHYEVFEVDGPYSPGEPILVSARTFALSPFNDDLIFAAGHDASGVPSNDMAWVFKAPLSTALGVGRIP